jgi:PAS domain S-box-containing protein
MKNMNEKIDLLIYSKVEKDADHIRKLISKSAADARVMSVKNKQDLLDAYNYGPRIVIFTIDNNETNYSELLQILTEHKPKCPFFIITASIGEDRIIELMKTKPKDMLLWKNADNIAIQVSNILNSSSHSEFSYFRHRDFFKKVIDSIPDCIIIKSIKDNKCEFINRSFIEIFDLNRNEIARKELEEILPQGVCDFIKKNDEMLLSSDLGLISYEDKVVFKGKEKWFNIQKMILTDENNQPEMILGIFIETTLYKIREIDLQKSVNKFSKLFNNSPYPMSIVHSKDGRILDINNSYLLLIGMRYEDVVGKTSLELKIWADINQRDELFRRALNNEVVKNQEVKIKSRDGSVRTLLMSIEQIKSDDNEDLLIFMALDITDRKTFIEEIRRSLAKEKDLNILKTRFISMISHEFRTPLTAIMLSTDLLKRYGGQWDDGEKQKHFDRIQNTVLRMTQLMESVLTIGRMEAGKFDFQPESMDLHSYCRSLAESIEFTASGKVKIKFVYSGNCNDPMIDENLIGLILTNLLSNAVKYSPHGKDIDFEVICSDGTASFVVRDQGIGIPEKDQKNLFNTFYRASNVGSASGYGLGLNIVKRCVEAHRGEIYLQSIENVGTTFTVKIPII